MQKKNRYRNRIRLMGVVRLLFIVISVGVIGGSFVLIRNQHVARGNEISDTETKIIELDREIEMWELRIAGVKDRSELKRRLRWVNSTLQSIDPERVLRIDTNDEFSRPVVGVF